MIPSDKVTLPEKTAQRYVFLSGPRRVPDHAALRWVSHAAARRLASSGMRGARVDWEGRERRLIMACVWNRSMPGENGGARPRIAKRNRTLSTETRYREAAHAAKDVEPHSSEHRV